MKTVLSGIQPSGNLTLGNYIGAIKILLSSKMSMIVTLWSSICMPLRYRRSQARLEIAPNRLRHCTLTGIDPNRANIFLQSHVPQHAELGWIMTTMVNMGELERMTQFKDKSEGKIP